MQENRKQPRKNLISYSQVFDLYAGNLLGYLADMNQLGVMVIGEKAMQAEAAITLQIEVPETEGISVKRLTIPARTVWCHPDISPEYFNIGFEFKEVNEEQKKVIQAIMDKYEFQRQLPKYPFRGVAKY